MDDCAYMEQREILAARKLQRIGFNNSHCAEGLLQSKMILALQDINESSKRVDLLLSPNRKTLRHET